jgi:hypothetical protein
MGDPGGARRAILAMAPPRVVALDVATGKLIGRMLPKHRSEGFRKFLNVIERLAPADLEVHLVLDNYATHKTEVMKR